MLYTNEAIKIRKKRQAKLKSLINEIIYIVLLPVLIYNIFIIGQAILNPNKTPNFLGIKTYIIVSGSMEPNLQIGDIAVVKEVPKEELKVGDIISFRQGQSVITHRINEILEDTYITKGDNNNTTDDEPITYEQIEGKVEKMIPIVGKFALMLHQKIAIIIFIVLVYMYVLYTGTIKRKKANRRIKREKYESENRHE